MRGNSSQRHTIISFEALKTDKLRWWMLADRLGYTSLSAMIRAALTQWEADSETTPR